VFCYVGRFGLGCVTEAPILPKTPTEKSRFNGNEQSGWSKNQGKQESRHILMLDKCCRQNYLVNGSE
jgi:hypothetical protein